MNYTSRTLANVLAGMEHQFHPVCQQHPDCGEPPKWMIWTYHGQTHNSFCAYSCAGHKDDVLEFWSEVIALGETCTCGQRISAGDPLGRWVRFIRL